eukprot:11172179-Lingulodinium_polyedra.AAC.1
MNGPMRLALFWLSGWGRVGQRRKTWGHAPRGGTPSTRKSTPPRLPLGNPVQTKAAQDFSVSNATTR